MVSGTAAYFLDPIDMWDGKWQETDGRGRSPSPKGRM